MPKRYSYDHPRPAVTVDTVLFTIRDGAPHVLLIQRGQEPYKDHWAIPGGFLELEEFAEDGARRELLEETGIAASRPMLPMCFMDDPARDPRGRVISLVYASACPMPGPEPAARDDARGAEWVPIFNVVERPLAFDHREVLGRGLIWLLSGVESGSIDAWLLPDEFALEDVKSLFRALERPVGTARGWLEELEDAGRIELIARKPKKRYALRLKNQPIRLLKV